MTAMDKAQRQQYKTLANDAIIRTFGIEGDEARLATALETCVDELCDIATDCEHCRTCDYHGDIEDDSIPIDAGEVIGVHGELKKLIKNLTDYHMKLSSELADEFPDLLLPNELAGIVEDIEQQVDELEACVTP